MSESDVVIREVISEDEQRGWMALAAFNRLEARSIPETRKRWQIGRWAIHYLHRSPRLLMGRFGGGWQWALGVEISRSSVALNLLVASLTVTRKRP